MANRRRKGDYFLPVAKAEVVAALFSLLFSRDATPGAALMLVSPHDSAAPAL